MNFCPCGDPRCGWSFTGFDAWFKAHYPRRYYWRKFRTLIGR